MKILEEFKPTHVHKKRWWKLSRNLHHPCLVIMGLGEGRYSGGMLGHSAAPLVSVISVRRWRGVTSVPDSCCT